MDSDQSNVEHLLEEIRGSEWRPTLLFKPMVVRELYETVVSLKKELSVITEPVLLKDLALLDLHITKAHLSKNRSQAEFMAHITNALMDVGSILEWLYRNKNLRNLKKGD